MCGKNENAQPPQLNHQNSQGNPQVNPNAKNFLARRPLQLERYRQLDFIDIPEYPKPIQNDIRNVLFIFYRNNSI